MCPYCDCESCRAEREDAPIDWKSLTPEMRALLKMKADDLIEDVKKAHALYAAMKSGKKIKFSVEL